MDARHVPLSCCRLSNFPSHQQYFRDTQNKKNDKNATCPLFAFVLKDTLLLFSKNAMSLCTMAIVPLDGRKEIHSKEVSRAVLTNVNVGQMLDIFPILITPIITKPAHATLPKMNARRMKKMTTLSLTGS